MANTEQPSRESGTIELSENGDHTAGLPEGEDLPRPRSRPSDPGAELFSEFAQALEDHPAQAVSKPAQVLDLGAAQDQVCNFEIDSFDYELDGDALLAAHPASDLAAGRIEEPQPQAVSAALSQRLAVLEVENAQLRRSLKQWQAEFDSMRRRTEREQAEQRLHIRGEIITQILPLVDNFERALSQAMLGPLSEEFITGVVLIYKQLSELLERHEVLPIPAVGEIFDPNLHEAVLIEPRPGYEANTVIAEIEKGYTIGSRLLRPARVKVAIRKQ